MAAVRGGESGEHRRGWHINGEFIRKRGLLGLVAGQQGTTYPDSDHGLPAIKVHPHPHLRRLSTGEGEAQAMERTAPRRRQRSREAKGVRDVHVNPYSAVVFGLFVPPDGVEHDGEEMVCRGYRPLACRYDMSAYQMPIGPPTRPNRYGATGR